MWGRRGGDCGFVLLVFDGCGDAKNYSVEDEQDQVARCEPIIPTPPPPRERLTRPVPRHRVSRFSEPVLAPPRIRPLTLTLTRKLPLMDRRTQR